ncbi:MAG: dTDP-4-dehydrorhamnose 3,5-epimerase [Deltaproteobacteria bacterium]|nr:dTDP-4-dehydrorhamnose 3,5-epimerase [Deltaproteobacteria bacterium]
MKFIELSLSGAFLIEPVVYNDKRGCFLEIYNQEIFQDHGVPGNFVQDNYSFSRQKGVLRGLHFQFWPHAQAKLIRVISGAIYDVIVDLRQNSSTYGQWISCELSEENMNMLFVPKGFAHGFCTLENNTHVIYKVDEYYAPRSDGGLRWDDPDLKVVWPLDTPILSEKDASLPFFKEIGHIF